MSDTTSKLIEYSNNQPKFTSIPAGSLVIADDKTFTGLSLPTSSDTSKQYVIKVNANGDYYFTDFAVTTDMQVSQAPNQWEMYGADNTKLAADGILVAMDNGATAYTIAMTSTQLCGLKYNNTTKKITAQAIYQGPKDWVDSSNQRLSKNGFVISTQNGSKAAILEVPSQSTYGITKTSAGDTTLTQINNHTHTFYELYVSKYQTTSDNIEDACYIETTSKPYYIINETGSGTTQENILRGTYLVDIDIDLVAYDLNLLQREVFTFKIGLGSIAKETLTIDQKMANRVNLHVSTIYTQDADRAPSITIGNGNISKCYQWDKIKLTMVKILN